MSTPGIQAWDERFSADGYLFGTDPNAFLSRSAQLIAPGGRVLAVADGEGRNGVWLAQQGFAVHAVEGSRVAIEKSIALAAHSSVGLASSSAELAPGTIWHEQADLMAWDWPSAAYDAVAAIFIQFATPSQRQALFAGMAAALRPGGVLLLEGYHHRQLQYGTGGPSVLDQLYDEALLRTAFPSLVIASIDEYDTHVDEGDGHRGTSALIDLVAYAT
jgi:SAM-dependent methyltransferase